MANIFKANKDVNEHPNRNNFDLSFQNHLTMKLGYLYPVFCRRVVPGDSFKIDTAFGLKFMPMVFPVQSKLRAHMHFFYVRNKNLWKNWENWISGLVTQDEHPHPYLAVDDFDVKSGSIHDFLNIPTTVASHEPIIMPVPMNYTAGSPQLFTDSGYTYWRIAPYISSGGVPNRFTVSKDILQSFRDVLSISDFSNVHVSLHFAELVSGSYVNLFNTDEKVVGSLTSVNFDLNESQHRMLYQHSRGDGRVYCFVYIDVVSQSYSATSITKAELLETFISVAGFYNYNELGLDLYSSFERPNALPYRAYESIYRAYYANSVLQPLRDENNKPVYNEYITNNGDGADATDYHLFKRNYELDPYTSAQPSPQQGVAPLVGMTALGNVTIEDENGVTTAHAEIDNDGTVSKVVLTSPAASIEHARTAMNIAAAGMSINDFRAGNALQRLLETSLRKGYRYMDFIAGHFGKEPEYRELDMPEFIGGFSRDVNVTTTFATADTYDEDADTGASLGDYVGNASCFGGSSSSVSHYCDDYGFIMGILCVTPTPAYSQVMPKQMICPQNYLDYFFPEMNSLGLQPITYEEVTPIQRYIEQISGSGKRLQDTFGYQRPYYDYVSAIDEVHGEFRGSMKDFLVNRIFSESPELGSDFLEINPEEVNDIFVNTTPEDDTIIGQVIMQVHAKRPINRIVIPGLGR